jgi:hypothetical protein
MAGRKRKVTMKRFRDYLPRDDKETVSGIQKNLMPKLFILCQFKILYLGYIRETVEIKKAIF